MTTQHNILESSNHQLIPKAIGRERELPTKPPLQIRRRIKQHHRNRILVRHKRARHPLRNILPARKLVAHIEHIRAEAPVGPRLVDRVPLVLLGEIRVAEIVALAWRDEVETQRAVGAERTFVGVPVEAAGGFGVARGLEFGHAWWWLC